MRLAVFAVADSFNSDRVSSTLAAATSGFGRSPFLPLPTKELLIIQ